MLLVLFSACGSQDDTPPVISGIRYPTGNQQPPRYQAGFNDGEVGMPGLVDFQDPDGDVVLLHIRWQDCGGGILKELDSLQQDLRNATSGSIPFIIRISTDCPTGDYAVRVSLSDGQGNGSNVALATYTIYE